MNQRTFERVIAAFTQWGIKKNELARKWIGKAVIYQNEHTWFIGAISRIGFNDENRHVIARWYVWDRRGYVINFVVFFFLKRKNFLVFFRDYPSDRVAFDFYQCQECDGFEWEENWQNHGFLVRKNFILLNQVQQWT